MSKQKKHLLDHKNNHNSLIGFVSFFIQIQFDSKNSISCCCQSSVPVYTLTIFLRQCTSHGSQELVHRHVDLRSEIVGKHGGQDHEEVVSKNLWKDEDHIFKKKCHAVRKCMPGLFISVYLNTAIQYSVLLQEVKH